MKTSVRLVLICACVQLLIFIIYYFEVSGYLNFNYVLDITDLPIGDGIWQSQKFELSTTKWTFSPFAQLKKSTTNLTELRIQATFLVLQRSLVLFSVREVNLKLNGSLCTKWWSNPLSVTEIEEKIVSHDVIQYKLIFVVQPGRILFESVVAVHKNHPNATNPYVSDDFVFISARRLDENKKCNKVDESLRKICLCPEEKLSAEKKTRQVRKKWNVADPEHPDWPVNATAMVSDFLTLGRLDIYLKKPNSTSEFCGSDVNILIFISSAPSHGKRRNAIRKTYGSPEYLCLHGIRLLFSFGRIQNPKIQKDVDQEAKIYNDILQSDFADHYQNQSLSELFVYNWIVANCEEHLATTPAWILKADDDSFINIPLLRRVAQANPTAEIIGCQDCPHSVQRASKASVPKYMYSPELWFGFVYGGAALIRTDILRPLLKASLTCPIVNLCDVYVTGLLSKQIGVRPVNSPLFQTSLIIRENSCSRLKFMVNTHVKATEDLELYWDAFHTTRSKDCVFNDQLLKADPITPKRKLDCFYD